MRRAIQVSIAFAVLMSTSAQADPILLSPGDEEYSGADCSATCGPGTPDILAWLDENVEGFDSSDNLYKSDEDGDAIGDDSGIFVDLYTTEFMNSIGDPMDATITWNGGPYLAEADWLLVKDGNNAPVWYLFDISGWDGMMDIVLTGFWPGSGAISHLAIFGAPRTIPEPGTLALLGIGLLFAAFFRRKIKT